MMVTYRDKSEKVHKKRVYYSGSSTLQVGYPLCYDRNQGTSTDEDLARAWEVEKPAAGNLNWVAGVVAEGYGGKTGPCEIEVIEPTPYPGTACNAWVGVATVIPGSGGTVTDLGIVASTWCLAAASATQPGVGYALTTDASTTGKARLIALCAQPQCDNVTQVAPTLTGGTTGGTAALGSMTAQAPGSTLATNLTAAVANIKRAFEAIADLKTDTTSIITALKKAKFMERV